MAQSLGFMSCGGRELQLCVALLSQTAILGTRVEERLWQAAIGPL